LPPEKQEGQQEYQANQATHHPMCIFKPEYRFKLVDVHIAIYLLVFGRLLVIAKLLEPLTGSEWRIMPWMGCQLTIDRPDPVSRVTPPSITITKISDRHNNSQ
jgi:hypothetical protein